MDPDMLRVWFDQRDTGKLAKEYPLQSMLCSASAMPICKRQSERVDDCIATFSKEFSVEDEPKECYVPSCSSSQYSDLLDSINFGSKFDDKWQISKAVVDGIKLANDLNLFKSGDVEFIGNENRLRSDPVTSNVVSELPETKSFVPPVKSAARDEPKAKTNPFQTAKEQFVKDGGKIVKRPHDSDESDAGKRTKPLHMNGVVNSVSNSSSKPKGAEDPDAPLIDRIESDIIQDGQKVTFGDIAGLTFAKKCVQEIICWPMARPDLFTGLRAVPRGLLLFGPPGTGKTLIGKAISHEIGATFFNISASSITSKWIGEGERLVRLLFLVAANKEPSVIFIDEIDSLLSQRSTDENEASRRMKTEFLVQLDGAGTDVDVRVVVVGATNRPEELDEAARRRFVKRLYIPLPEDVGREQLLRRLMDSTNHALQAEEVARLVDSTQGYSGADIKALCTEAAMGPIRDITASCSGDLRHVTTAQVPPIGMTHFTAALDTVAATVTDEDLGRYIQWNSKFGTFRNKYM